MSQYNFDGHKLFYQFETTYKLLTDKPVYPVYVEYSPVGSCNHRCKFCAYDYIGYQSRRLETKATLRSIKEFAALGTKAMLFAGEGEPLVHKDLPRMIETCYESGIDTGIYTNGSLMNEAFSERTLDKLTFIRISFNAGTRENYKEVHGADDFEKVVENIKTAAAIKKRKGLHVDIGMQIVVIPENLQTIIQLAKLCTEIGADYLAVKPFVQHNDQLGYEFSENFSLEKIDGVLTEAESYSTDDCKIIARKEAFRKYHDRSYEHCLGLPLFSVVLSDGNVYSCGPFLGDDRFKYGNIYESSIKEIMDGEARHKILKHAGKSLCCKTECMPNCRLDAINRSLWELKNPSVKHVNFI
jgi:radical SAM protein with 4Fe4S-binding SPASM domain